MVRGEAFSAPVPPPGEEAAAGEPDWGSLLASWSLVPAPECGVRAPQTGRERRPGEVPASTEGSDSGTGGCPLQKPNLRVLTPGRLGLLLTDPASLPPAPTK